jgi:glycosyltransferase involved in cell wall biosynthesis
MRIAVVSKGDYRGGGGSRFAQEVAGGYIRKNHTVLHFHTYPLQKESPKTEVSIFGIFRIPILFIRKFLKFLGFQELPGIGDGLLLKHLSNFSPDLVHLHDTAGTYSPDTIRKIGKRFPTVWTLHDASIATGGCLFPLECKKYLQECGNCPQKLSWPIQSKFDQTTRVLLFKKKIYSDLNIHLVSPTNWLGEVVRSVLSVSYSVIPNGIQLRDSNLSKDQVFHDQEKQKSERFKICMVSNDFLNPYKGVSDGIACINQLKSESKIEIHLVGGNSNFVVGKFKDSISVIDHGFQVEKENIRKILKSSHILLYTTKADNFPLVILESLSVGTPVCGYATGGIPEIIENEIQGILVPTGNHSLLARKIESLILDKKRLERMQESAQIHLLSQFTMDKVIDRYLSLFQEILNRQSL